MTEKTPVYPLLVIDTASRKTWVGLKLSADTLIKESEEQDPSKTLFRLVDALLEKAAITLSDLRSIALCAGPGSMLGARTASMAIRAWKGIGITAANNVYYYSSLAVGCLIASEAFEEGGIVVTDARRSSWNALPFPNANDSELSLLTNDELESTKQTIVTLSEFPSWTKTEAALETVAYDPTPIFESKSFLKILKPTHEATPLTIRSNEYKKWDAKIHSAAKT